MELPDLYRQMLRSRLFEVAVAGLWREGMISGEMHMGTGEEAVVAGVVTLLREGDGLAVTHRATPAFVVRGVPLVAMLRELLGREDGLDRGRAGHMRLMSREHLAAASGIVGASLPAGAGFALAAKCLRPGAVAVAFTGDGAMNQGMALETLNLAVAWSLPLLVVCVDNTWAITTNSREVTGGKLPERARAFGWHVAEVDGTAVVDVHEAARALISRLRRGHEPVFIHAQCPRLDGHFLGDPLIAQASRLTSAETRRTVGRVVSGATSRAGAGARARISGVARMVGAMARARFEVHRDGKGDPMRIAREALDRRNPGLRAGLEEEVQAEIAEAVEAAGGRDA